MRLRTRPATGRSFFRKMGEKTRPNRHLTVEMKVGVREVSKPQRIDKHWWAVIYKPGTPGPICRPRKASFMLNIAIEAATLFLFIYFLKIMIIITKMFFFI